LLHRALQEVKVFCFFFSKKKTFFLMKGHRVGIRQVAKAVSLTVSMVGWAQATSAAPPTEAAGHITGFGGVFVTSNNPTALAAWYRDVLGLSIEAWGGAILRYDTPGHPPMALWYAMLPGSTEIKPSARDFMLNFAVDNLDAFVARLKAKHIEILKQDEDATGKFAWLLDPDGTKIELWEPKAK